MRPVLPRILQRLRRPKPARQPLSARLESPPMLDELPRNERASIELRVLNQGPEPWWHRGPHRAVLEHRWLTREDGRQVAHGQTTPLRKTVRPGQSLAMKLSLTVPDLLGDLLLEITLHRCNTSEQESQGHVLHLPCRLNDPPWRDCDYVEWYRRAPLERNHWRIVGPETLEEHDRLREAQLRLMSEEGLQPHWSVLDVGCGTGKVAEALSPILNEDGSYVGTDIGAEGIAYCRHRFARERFRFLVNEPSTLPLREERFDLIVFFSVFTHTYPEETASLLKEARRLLKPEGRIVADAFVSPLVLESAGRRGAVELNEALLLRLIEQAELKAERLEQHGQPWGRFGRRLFLRLRHRDYGEGMRSKAARAASVKGEPGSPLASADRRE